LSTVARGKDKAVRRLPRNAPVFRDSETEAQSFVAWASSLGGKNYMAEPVM